MKKQKLLQKLLSGNKNVRFSEAVALAEAFGFQLDRINGSHHIFIHEKIPELLNIQNVKGKAKPYQVRQMLQLIETHNLQLEGE
jgi:predicted RNA binding protein YcfA (HicA-like mRNA interferase family)